MIKLNSWLLMTALAAILGTFPGIAAEMKHGTVVTEHIDSLRLRETKTGLVPMRSVKIYLPPGYAESGKSYPVIYYFHSFFWSPEKMFADGNLQRLLERGFANGIVPEFILVAADYSTPTTGSFFENSSVTGHWLDFTTEELVPFIDSQFRTLPQRESRGVAGDMIGGYGALKFALLYPDLFSVVYALHPVATGTGLVPMASRPDWRKIYRAKSFQDIEEWDVYTRIFLSMSQAFLPNPARPPFYCDFMMEPKDGEPTLDPEHIKKLQSGFLLDQMLAEKGANLRRMRGIKFDWGRYDGNQDHVYANQVFTRKLDELGIEHEAEEYRGNYSDKNWTEYGRFYSSLLPFFARHLVFEK